MSFKYVKPSEEQVELMQNFRDKFEKLFKEIKEKVPSSRALSLAETNLEQASMWINKAITEGKK